MPKDIWPNKPNGQRWGMWFSVVDVDIRPTTFYDDQKMADTALSPVRLVGEMVGDTQESMIALTPAQAEKVTSLGAPSSVRTVKQTMAAQAKTSK